MGYTLVDEIAPYFCIIDFAETNVDPAYCSDTPRKRPAGTMEHRQGP